MCTGRVGVANLGSRRRQKVNSPRNEGKRIGRNVCVAEPGQQESDSSRQIGYFSSR